MDQLQVKVVDGTAQFTMSTKLIGLEATMAVKSDSVDNPFVMPQLKQFRCPATL
jgi:type VI protein secretion system component VasK